MGCGAVASHGPHFQLQWPEKWSTIDIAPKEMAPVVIAAALWGGLWTNSQVLFRCENSAVVEVINNHSAKDPVLLTWRGACFSLQPPTDSNFQPSMSQGSRMGWWLHSLRIVMTYLFLDPHRFHLRPHSSSLPYTPCCSTNQSNEHLHVGGGSLQILCSRSVREHLLYIHVQKETIRQLLLSIWTPGSSPSETTLCLFVAFLAQAGVSAASIHTYLVAVRHLYISLGFTDAFGQHNFPRLYYVINRVRRETASMTTQHSRLPVTPAILRILFEMWSP